MVAIPSSGDGGIGVLDVREPVYGVFISKNLN
jgi:hypothetical protein